MTQPKPDARTKTHPDEVLRQVEYIVDLMVRGAWHTSMVRKLAGEWGIAERTVRDRSAVASKIVWANTSEEREQLRAETIAKLGVLALKAEAQDDLRNAINALTERGRIAGIHAPEAIVNLIVPGMGPVPMSASTTQNEFKRVLELIWSELSKFPEALAAVTARLEEAVTPKQIAESVPVDTDGEEVE